MNLWGQDDKGTLLIMRLVLVVVDQVVRRVLGHMVRHVVQEHAWGAGDRLMRGHNA